MKIARIVVLAIFDDATKSEKFKIKNSDEVVLQLSCTDPPCPAPPRYTVNAGLGGTGPRRMRSLDVLPNLDPRLAQALAVQARGIPIFINTCASDGNWAVPTRCVPSRHL